MSGKAGSITVVRHGKPAINRDVTLNASEYDAFWAKYEIGGLHAEQQIPDHLAATVNAAKIAVVSTRPRAIESARLLLGERLYDEDERLIEAPLPSPPFPALFRFSPRMWGFFARVWWWVFNHHKGQETRAQAEARAHDIAVELVELAKTKGDVLVVAHGFFNAMIGAELKRLGWRKTFGRGWKYWSTRRYEQR